MNINEVFMPPEMKTFFNERTEKHIGRVQKYCQKIADKFPNLAGVVNQAKTHDATKYEEPEFTPYVHLTWRYKCRDEGGDYEIPMDHHEATMHHIKSNRHHPEFHDPGVNDKSLNRENRDAVPERPTNGTQMNDIDIAEMVGDWMAMSEEKGGNPKDWADKNVNKRWLFLERQIDMIYDIIDKVWE
jgi:hypothetical protein